MTRVNFIVEGPTEEVFVKQVLTPYLAARNVFVKARSVETSRHAARVFRGGLSNYAKARNDINRWLSEDREAFLTTMFDFYALPNDFPGFSTLSPDLDPYRKVEYIQHCMGVDINSARFVPYIQLHEYEALLFADPVTIDNWMGLFNEGGRVDALNRIKANYLTPEHINSGYDTAPSRRLLSIYDAYDKVFVGSGAAEDIGIERMRTECIHFDNWLNHLCSL